MRGFPNAIMNSWQRRGCRRLQKQLLLVIPWMAMGGADKINVDLVRILSKAGWGVTIVNTLSTSGQSDISAHLDFSRPQLQQYTEDIFTLPHLLRVDDYARFLLYMAQSRGVDAVVLSNSFVAYNLVPFLKSRLPNVIFADYVHMREKHWTTCLFFETPCGDQGGGYPRLSGKLSPWLDLSLFVSEDERQWVATSVMGLPEPNARQHTVYHGISLPTLNSDTRLRVRQILGLEPQTLCIVFVGRIVDQKQPDVLARVFRRLVAHYPEDPAAVHLVVVGTGERFDQLDRTLKWNGLADYVTLLGSIARHSVPALLMASDVYFMPSKMEGISISLIEAMGHGLVPVVTDVGGQSELVRAGAGYLTDPDDEEMMLSHLVDLQKSPSLRVQMGRRAREIVKSDFSIATLEKRLPSLLLNATALRTIPAEHSAISDLSKAIEHINEDVSGGEHSMVSVLNRDC